MASDHSSSTTEPGVTYATLDDIRQRHGVIVSSLYRLTDLVAQASIGHRWRALPHNSSRHRRWLDTGTNKPTPSWQDWATLVPMLLLTVLSLGAAFSGPQLLGSLGAAIAGYSLFVDTLNYYVRVLWFDDLTPGIANDQRGVWSNRRILFLAILGYFQSILLFAAMYRAVPWLSSVSFGILLRRSFLAATLFEVAPDASAVDAIQVLTSLFFVAIVIAVISASGYERSEISSRGKNEAA